MENSTLAQREMTHRQAPFQGFLWIHCRASLTKLARTESLVAHHNRAQPQAPLGMAQSSHAVGGRVKDLPWQPGDFCPVNVSGGNLESAWPDWWKMSSISAQHRLPIAQTRRRLNISGCHSPVGPRWTKQQNPGHYQKATASENITVIVLCCMVGGGSPDPV